MFDVVYILVAAVIELGRVGNVAAVACKPKQFRVSVAQVILAHSIVPCQIVY